MVENNLNPLCGRQSGKVLDYPRKRFLIYVSVFLLTWAVFFSSPLVFLGDSHYSMLLSLDIIKHGTPIFETSSIPRFSTRETWVQPNGYSWQIRKIDGKLLYYYPHGSSILSIPFVAALNLVGISPAHPDGSYDSAGEVEVEIVIAATLMAGLTCLFLAQGLFLLPSSWSLIIALGAAFGTQIWSNATRALWSHTWFIFLLGWVLYFLMKAEIERSRLHPALIATLVSSMFFVRPTAAIPISAISIYVLLFYRRDFPVYLAAGVFWLGAFLCYSVLVFGQILPPYYAESGTIPFRLSGLRVGLEGVLISPSRGLLIYEPVAVFIFYSVIRYWKLLPSRPMTVLCLLVTAMHILCVSLYAEWWGGYAYGPRLLTDALPWLVVLAIFGCSALREDFSRTAALGGWHRWRPALLIGVGFVLLMVGVAINSRGACSPATAQWHLHPVDVDYYQERLWDWKHPQFLAGLLR